MFLTKAISAILAAALLFSACSTTKPDGSATVEERTGKPVGRDSGGTQTAPVQSADISKSGNRVDNRAESTKYADPFNDPASVLAKRSIFFDVDSFSVKEEFKPVLEAHAQYLIARSDRKVVLQGHTDERGGSEYNLALGQKRAEAVRRTLAIFGVPEAQMEAVSFGKEKPRATGSDEAAWAENRRCDLAY